MNQIITIGKNLAVVLLCVLALACKDDKTVDGTALTLLSYTPHEDDNIPTEGVIELTFSKSVRQAPDTDITLNGTPVRVIITDNVVRAHYSLPLADHIRLLIPEGALTDMDGAQAFSGLDLNLPVRVEAHPFDAIVDANGHGDYTSVQAAIDQAPANATQPYLIFVADGAYNECITIPANKPYIHLIGQSREGTRIQFLLNRVQWKDPATPKPEGWEYSAYNPDYQATTGLTSANEAVCLVLASDFHAENLSFVNLYGARADVYGGRAANGQADALMTRADRISLYNCRMVSYQDTWWVRNNQSDRWRGLNNRNYADSCWIEGKTDYLYGNGNLLVERSTFFNVGTSGNVMTAGAHFPGTAWGHIMRGCTVDGLPSANGTTFFGRPWQQEPVAVWIDTRCKVSLDPAGWMDMGALPKVYGEYGTTDAEGNPVDTSRRKTTFAVGGKQVPYPGNIVLDAADAAKYTYDAIITADDGWDPRSYYTDKHLPAPAHVALDGTTLTWDGLNRAVCYLVFRDGVLLGQTTETTYTVPSADGTYTVRAANKYGNLSD